jgi:iron-sulfur cluster assembly protein
MSVELHTAVNSPSIILTDDATRHVVSYLKKHETSCGIRLSVKKTGCSGLSYVVDYVDAPLPEDITMQLDHDYLICVDKSSFPYLKGMQVDYVKQGLNSKFVFDNPNQTGQCGCGESFTVKE